jgi:hypothetical protein
MRRVLGLLAGCGLIAVVVAAPAWAWTESFSWSPVTGATSYKVEKSADTGATWTVASSPTAPAYVYTGTEPGLVLFRVSACNAIGCGVRAGTGFWHNEAWLPPPAPANLGVQ